MKKQGRKGKLVPINLLTFSFVEVDSEGKEYVIKKRGKVTRFTYTILGKDRTLLMETEEEEHAVVIRDIVKGSYSHSASIDEVEKFGETKAFGKRYLNEKDNGIIEERYQEIFGLVNICPNPLIVDNILDFPAAFLPTTPGHEPPEPPAPPWPPAAPFIPLPPSPPPEPPLPPAFI